MRYRIIVETDFEGSPRTFRDVVRNNFLLGELAKAIPGNIVYLASDTVETAVLSHDGKIVTVG